MSADLETLLRILQNNTSPSPADPTVAGLVDPSQPKELQQLLETLAAHPHGGIQTLGRYAIATDCVAAMSTVADDLPGHEPEFLPGFSTERAIQIGVSDDGESFLFAAWRPGDASATVVEWIAGGYENDGPRLVASGLIAGLRDLVMEYGSTRDDVDLEDEDEVAAELCDDNHELAKLMVFS